MRQGQVVVRADVISQDCAIKLLTGQSKELKEGAFVKWIHPYYWPAHAKDFLGCDYFHLVHSQWGMGFVYQDCLRLGSSP
jgi:hypothetical protein